MKSKLQTTIGELYRLKNQIRIQLNQIRPKQFPKYSQIKQKSAKRLFKVKTNDSTSIVEPSAQKSKPPKQSSKRLFNQQDIVFTQTSRVIQKKHYQRHYADNVNLENHLKNRTCSYFHVSPSKQKDSHHNTSLTGIGLHDKSLNPNKSRKRIFQEKLVFKRNLI